MYSLIFSSFLITMRIFYAHFGDHSLWKWEALKDGNEEEMKLVCYENCHYNLVLWFEWISIGQISIWWKGQILD